MHKGFIKRALAFAGAIIVVACMADGTVPSPDGAGGGQVGTGGNGQVLTAGNGQTFGGNGQLITAGTGQVGTSGSLGSGATSPGTGGAGPVAGGGGTTSGGGTGPGNGYITAGTWHGYSWTATAGVGTMIMPPDFSAVPANMPLCANGSVAPQADSGGVGMVGVNLSQDMAANSPAGTVVPTQGGITVSVTNTGGSLLRAQLQGPNGATDANQRWCATITGTGGFIPWSSFNTKCWAPTTGTVYDGRQPLTSFIVIVPGNAASAQSFNFCLNRFAEGMVDLGGPGGGDGGSGNITDPVGWVPVSKGGRNYIVQNNVFNGNGSMQTLSFNNVTFNVTQQTGNVAANGNPVSYPSVFIGAYNNKSTAGSGLPKLVSSLGTVQTTWATNAGTPGGNYNAAYDVWFSSGAGGDPAASSPTGGYLMVWLYKPGGAQPIGSPLQGVTARIANRDWAVWTGNNGGRPVISYVGQNISSLAFDLNLFIRDAVMNRPGTIQNNWYLSVVFAGFEIWSGGVGLQTTDFSVVVN